MAVTAAQVKSFAPAFAAVADTVVDTWLGWAPDHVAAAAFGAQHDQAVMLWVCHQLQVTQGAAAGAAGPLTAAAAGDVSASFGGGSAAATGLERTSWGQQLILLQRRKAGIPRMV